jgi:hypothetical protein
MAGEPDTGAAMLSEEDNAVKIPLTLSLKTA